MKTTKTETKLSKTQIKVVDLVTAGADHEYKMPARYRRTVAVLVSKGILARDPVTFNLSLT